jgi:hypothetical protein
VPLPGFLTVRDVDPHHLERYLLPQEEQTVTIRRHPAMLLRYFGESLGGLILAGVLSAVVSNSTILTVIWVAWLAVLSRLAFKVFEWSDEFFAVTGVRVMLVHGLVTRRSPRVRTRRCRRWSTSPSPRPSTWRSPRWPSATPTTERGLP